MFNTIAIIPSKLWTNRDRSRLCWNTDETWSQALLLGSALHIWKCGEKSHSDKQYPYNYAMLQCDPCSLNVIKPE